MFKINSRRERERKRDGLIVSTRACLEPTIQIAFCPFTNWNILGDDYRSRVSIVFVNHMRHLVSIALLPASIYFHTSSILSTSSCSSVSVSFVIAFFQMLLPYLHIQSMLRPLFSWFVVQVHLSSHSLFICFVLFHITLLRCSTWWSVDSGY